MTRLEQLQTMSDEALVELYNNHLTISKMLRSVGYKSYPAKVGAYVIKRLSELNVYSEDNTFERFKQYSEEEFNAALTASNSWSEMCLKLNVTICTFNFKRLQRLCQERGHNTEHLNNTNKFRSTTAPVKYTEENAFSENSSIPRGNLRTVLRRVGFYTGKCEICDVPDVWNGQPLTLEVDHINGDCRDNRKANLRWLCPNCHSQTPTFRRRKMVREE